jgi:hypothetical protein
MIGAGRHDGHVSYASAQVRGAIRASPVGKDRDDPGRDQVFHRVNCEHGVNFWGGATVVELARSRIADSGF